MIARNGKDTGSRAALVIGGGIAGATVAMRLGEVGFAVHLIERERALGGHVRDMGCKAGDVCVRCNVCVAAERLRALEAAVNVTVHLGTELLRLSDGRAGVRFTAMLSPAAPAEGSTKNATVAVDADVVVVATGFDAYRPAENAGYGCGRIPNVITGVEAEAQLAAAPCISRPSDGARPARVAFIQCVGSRTEEMFRRPEDTDYCSTVCCAYALRMARQLLHRDPAAAVTVFYMDIQHFDKDFDRFFAACRERLHFVRSRPDQMQPGPGGSVRVRFAAEAGMSASVCEELFDLVVLAVGIRPRADARELADRLRLPLDARGFFGLDGGGAFPALQRAGFYVAGTAESPKDIAGCLAQAEAVSARILADCRDSHRDR